jgi:hypothetical protein
MTLVGFILTDPSHPSTPAARSTTDLSVTVLEIFGTSFAVAANAAKIVRDLCTKVDFLCAQTRASGSDTILDVANGEQQLFMGNGGSMTSMNSSMDVDLTSGFFDMHSGGSNQNLLLFDGALAVDFWAEFEMLWPNTGPLPLSENWTLAQ